MKVITYLMKVITYLMKVIKYLMKVITYLLKVITYPLKVITYLMKVISETRRAHYIWYLRFFVIIFQSDWTQVNTGTEQSGTPIRLTIDSTDVSGFKFHRIMKSLKIPKG